MTFMSQFMLQKIGRIIKRKLERVSKMKLIPNQKKEKQYSAVLFNTEELIGSSSLERVPAQNTVNRTTRITFWDMPAKGRTDNLHKFISNFSQIENSQRFFNRNGYSRLELEVRLLPSKTTQLQNTWALPQNNEALTRITVGERGKDLLRESQKISAKLCGLPKNTNEVIL